MAGLRASKPEEGDTPGSGLPQKAAMMVGRMALSG